MLALIRWFHSKNVSPNCGKVQTQKHTQNGTHTQNYTNTHRTTHTHTHTQSGGTRAAAVLSTAATLLRLAERWLL